MLRGFSLVELSIVLVILGLLTGGILAGQSLIRAAELRSFATEYQRYIAATYSFRDKYFALPGDFSSATKFWGRLNTNADCVSNHGLAVAGTPGVCDGNGSGIILTSAAAASQASEQAQFWRHLALAGLIEGSYTGLVGSAGALDYTPNENIPASKLSNSGWVAHSYGSSGSGNANFYEIPYDNVFMIGPRQGPANMGRGPVMTPAEAWNADTKVDDGRPAYGKLVAVNWGNLASANRCTINAANMNDLDSDYNLEYASIICGVLVRQIP